jgi:integrase
LDQVGRAAGPGLVEQPFGDRAGDHRRDAVRAFLVDPLADFVHVGGTPSKPNAVTKDWQRSTALPGPPRISLHALRHTHASQLIAAGMDVLTISRRLGHGSPTVTLKVYGHLFTNTDDRAVQVMDASFAKAREMV